jgi:hypothetical protein
VLLLLPRLLCESHRVRLALVEALLLLTLPRLVVSQDNSVLELKRVVGGSGRSNILLQSLRK